jgi:hypothetical protein
MIANAIIAKMCARYRFTEITILVVRNATPSGSACAPLNGDWL